MARSIITDDMETCFICGANYHTEKHHCIHGTANRKVAEKYGLVVGLCPYCHRISDKSVHNDITVDRHLMNLARKAFEKHYPELDMLEVFGKRYDYEDSELIE